MTGKQKPARVHERASANGVIDGIRTRDTRDHNPVLYLLSYDHHLHLAVPANHSGIPPGAVERVVRTPG